MKALLIVGLALLVFAAPHVTAESQRPVSKPAFQGPDTRKDGPNQSSDKGEDTGAGSSSRLGQAIQLAAYARQNESPFAMVTAVQMLRRIRIEDGKARVGEKKSEGTPAGGAEKGTTPAPSVDPTTLLNEARTWAHGNPPVLALIEAELLRPARAGALSRLLPYSLSHRDSVLAHSSDYYTLTFRGGEVATIQVIGDGDTDLDCDVQDEAGNLITRDDNTTDYCVLQWTPRWTGPFRLKISNPGQVYNQYTLLTPARHQKDWP